MRTVQSRLIVALFVTVALSGCTDKDREMARRTGDGSETFKYQPPSPNEPAKPQASPSSPPAGKNPHGTGDGSDTFHYKPDARGFPTPPKPAGK